MMLSIIPAVVSLVCFAIATRMMITAKRKILARSVLEKLKGIQTLRMRFSLNAVVFECDAIPSAGGMMIINPPNGMSVGQVIYSEDGSAWYAVRYYGGLYTIANVI